MDLSQLRVLLEQEGVDPASYSLEGGTPLEAYVLEVRPAAWAVFYSERGLRSGERQFGSEGEACDYLLELVLRDPTTRRTRD